MMLLPCPESSRTPLGEMNLSTVEGGMSDANPT
jgi:hypothetical protein